MLLYFRSFSSWGPVIVPPKEPYRPFPLPYPSPHHHRAVPRPSRWRPPPAVPAVVRGAPRRTLGGGAGASSSAAAAVAAVARTAAGLAGRSCLCARHLRRRHLGGGLRDACGKAWRRAPRGAGSGSAHCGGAELGPEAGSAQDAVSVQCPRGTGPGFGDQRRRGPWGAVGRLTWPCSGRPL